MIILVEQIFSFTTRNEAENTNKRLHFVSLLGHIHILGFIVKLWKFHYV